MLLIIKASWTKVKFASDQIRYYKLSNLNELLDLKILQLYAIRDSFPKHKFSFNPV
jgi:hypothetical protein